MGKLRFRGANDFSKSQRGQQQSWYQPRPPGSQADVFAKPRLKCPSQEVAGGGGVPGWPQQSRRLRSQPPSLFPCEVPERVLHGEGRSALHWRLQGLEWEGQDERGRMGGQGFILWVTHTPCPNYGTKCPAASLAAFPFLPGCPGRCHREQAPQALASAAPVPRGAEGAGVQVRTGLGDSEVVTSG